MTMTDERLAELDAVMAKATAGEWEIYGEPEVGLLPSLFSCETKTWPSRTPLEPLCRDDEAAIVALHNAYADLRAMIEAQAATIARGLSIHEREALCGAFLTTTVEAGKCYATLKVKDVTTLHNLHDALIALRAALTGAA